MIIRKATLTDAGVLATNQVHMALESENIMLDYQTVSREPALTWKMKTVGLLT